MKLMIDIETLATSPRAAILSIAAITFDLDPDQSIQSFYQIIKVDSIPKKAFDIDMNTVAWWDLDKNSDAKAEAFSGTEPMNEVLADFVDFFKFLPEDIEIYTRGQFDTFILEHALEVYDLPVPWNYWQVNDLRTLAKIEGMPPRPENPGLPHHAYSDCLAQIDHAEMILAKLRSNEFWAYLGRAAAVGLGLTAILALAVQAYFN